MKITQGLCHLVEEAHCERFGKAFLGVNEEVESAIFGVFLDDVDEGPFLEGPMELDDVEAVETSMDLDFSLQVLHVLWAQERDVDFFECENLLRIFVSHSIHLRKPALSYDFVLVDELELLE